MERRMVAAVNKGKRFLRNIFNDKLSIYPPLLHPNFIMPAIKCDHAKDIRQNSGGIPPYNHFLIYYFNGSGIDASGSAGTFIKVSVTNMITFTARSSNIVTAIRMWWRARCRRMVFNRCCNKWLCFPTARTATNCCYILIMGIIVFIRIWRIWNRYHWRACRDFMPANGTHVITGVSMGRKGEDAYT